MTERVLVIGGPRTGKTTVAKQLAEHAKVRLRHTDSLLEMKVAWSEVSERVARWLDDAGPWIIEGVALPRALRKWIDANAVGKPCDVIYWLSKPTVARTKGQESMAKATMTVWMQVQPELLRRGVEVRNVQSITGVT